MLCSRHWEYKCERACALQKQEVYYTHQYKEVFWEDTERYLSQLWRRCHMREESIGFPNSGTSNEILRMTP